MQAAVVAQGYPAPPVLASGAGPRANGWYFVMPRAAGAPPLSAASAGALVRAVPSLALHLPALLADLAVRLHQLDPAPLRDALHAQTGMAGRCRRPRRRPRDCRRPHGRHRPRHDDPHDARRTATTRTWRSRLSRRLPSPQRHRRPRRRDRGRLDRGTTRTTRIRCSRSLRCCSPIHRSRSDPRSRARCVWRDNGSPTVSSPDTDVARELPDGTYPADELSWYTQLHAARILIDATNTTMPRTAILRDAHRSGE